jgi:hypothetical protein
MALLSRRKEGTRKGSIRVDPSLDGVNPMIPLNFRTKNSSTIEIIFKLRVYAKINSQDYKRSGARLARREN